LFVLFGGWGNGSIWPTGNAFVYKSCGASVSPCQQKKPATCLVATQTGTQKNPPGLSNVLTKSKLWESDLVTCGGMHFWKCSYRNTELQLSRSWIQSLL